MLPSTYILDKEPTEFTANHSHAWRKSLLPHFPASAGWQLSYRLTPPSGEGIDIAWSTHVTAIGDDFSVAIPPSLTSAVSTSGEGLLEGKVSNGVDIAPIYRGSVVLFVVGDLGHTRRMVAAIQAMLYANASREERQLSTTTPTGVSKALELCSKQELHWALTYWENKLSAQKQAERIRLGLGSKMIFRNRYTAP